MSRAAVAALALLAACATARSPLERAAARAASPDAPAASLAAAGFHDWLHRGEPAAAAGLFARAAQRDPHHPWARLGAAFLAQRALDDEGEASHLLALVGGAPEHPLAPVAARRLGELARRAPAIGQALDRELEPLLARGRLAGLAAHRARLALASAAEARGDLERAAGIRAQTGVIQAFALVGPCGARAGLDFDRPFPPEGALLPSRCDGPPGLPAAEPRAIAFTEGLAVLEGEPPGAEVWYLAADLHVARGGRYLLAVLGTTSLRVWIDGRPAAERRTFAGFPPMAQLVPWSLEAGTHRLLVKVTRGTGRAALALAVARADGMPSDVQGAPAAAGPAPPARPGAPPSPLLGARDLAVALEPEAGPALSRLVAARDRLETDREAAKALLEEALALLPAAAPLLAARGEAHQEDPTLAERVRRARAEAAFAEALRRDPGDAATRLSLAELLRSQERLEDSQAVMAGMAEIEASRPRALVERARTLQARGFREGAERLLGGARGDCRALELLEELSSRRDAVAREAELARELASCPGGLERLAEFHRARGDARAAADLRMRLARAAPARVEARLSLARALAARGDPAAGARELVDLERIWPRDPRLPRRRADLLELALDQAGARAARERALFLDGSDLSLRRALALEDGSEALADLAEDGQAAIRAYRASSFRPASSSVMVLDAVAVEAHLDGAVTERVHQVTHLLDPRGVERWGEASLPAGAEVLALRSLKADGRTLEAEEGRAGKSSASLSGLEPGDYVEVEYLRSRPARGAGVPGFSAEPFYFRAEDLPLFRSTYAVAAPRGSGLAVDAHHMTAPPPREEGGRQVVRIEAREVKALVGEPGDPGVAEYLPFVQVGAGSGREEMQLTLADAVLEGVRPSLEVRRLAGAVARPPGAAAPLGGEALLREAYQKVNQMVEGQGGSWAEPASHVLSRGRGSRTVLLKALYAALGVKARLALVRTFQADPAPYRFPRPDLYGHPVLRVEQAGRVHWLDPSTRHTPFGVLPPAARGCEALLLPEPGEPPEVARTPGEGEDGREMLLRISLDAAGGAALSGEERYLGYDGAAAKAALEALDSAGRRQAVEQALARSFAGLTLESLEVLGEQVAEVPLTLRWRARAPAVARLAGGRAAIEAVVHPLRLGARFVQRSTRETPLLVASEERSALRLEVTLPEGAVPPEPLEREVSSEFGSYRRSERFTGGAILREDTYRLRRARVAPDAYAAFVRFAAAVDEIQALPVALGARP